MFSFDLPVPQKKFFLNMLTMESNILLNCDCHLDQHKRPQPPKEPYKRFLQQRLVLVVSYLIERQKNNRRTTDNDDKQKVMTILEIRV